MMDDFNMVKFDSGLLSSSPQLDPLVSAEQDCREE